MDMQKGRLLISTKASSDAAKKMILFSCGYSYFVAFLLLIFFNPFIDLLVEITDCSTMTAILIIMFILLFLVVTSTVRLVMTRQRYQSYCAVYENGVAGKTFASDFTSKMPIQTFDLSYSDILNVAEGAKSIIITTTYGQLEAFAPQNLAEAVQAIRVRLSH